MERVPVAGKFGGKHPRGISPVISLLCYSIAKVRFNLGESYGAHALRTWAFSEAILNFPSKSIPAVVLDRDGNLD